MCGLPVEQEIRHPGLLLGIVEKPSMRTSSVYVELPFCTRSSRHSNRPPLRKGTPQEFGECFGVAQLPGMPPEGMDHMIVAALAVAFLNESATGPSRRLIHFRVQRGEEQVLENGRVVGAGIRRGSLSS